MSVREQIMAANDLPLDKVNVPEWNCDVYIKSLSGRERLQLEADIKRDEDNALFRVVCLCMCDQKGERLFSYPDEVDLLKGKSVKVVQRLFKQALKMNAMRSEDVEDIVKN